MGFKLFEKKRTHGGPATVTITKYGNFVVNSTAIEKYFKGFKYVHIYWDEAKDKVGIKPLSKQDEKAYHLNYSPKGNVATISGIAFLSYAEIPHNTTTPFQARWNGEERLLEFKVNRARLKGRGRD